MRAGLKSSLGVFALFSALTAAAAPNAQVEAVQAPAWVQRGERRLPLAPGMVLENRDHLLTGAGARAIVQLADGSAVKLGENVNVAVNAMQTDENGVFSAALDILKGAFRLTTNIFQKYQRQRAINIRAGTVTIGIRGTDLWGRSNEQRDFVCLLEGKIAVSHPLGEPVVLDQPLQFYGADHGQAPGPVSVAKAEQVSGWAAETELREAAGTRRLDGRWQVVFDAGDEGGALAWYDQLTNAGFASRIMPLRKAGGYRYELRLGQLVTEREALALADQLVRDLHVPAPVVRRR